MLLEQLGRSHLDLFEPLRGAIPASRVARDLSKTRPALGKVIQAEILEVWSRKMTFLLDATSCVLI